MSKVKLNDIGTSFQSRQALNENFRLIEEAIDNTVSRDGSTPNQMTADLNLNGNYLLNVKGIVLTDGEQFEIEPYVEHLSKLLDVNPEDKVVITVLNYHEGLEGGGGVFSWDATKAKSEHDGIDFIDPTVVFPESWENPEEKQVWFNSSNTGVGCWVRMVKEGAQIAFPHARAYASLNDTSPTGSWPFSAAEEAEARQEGARFTPPAMAECMFQLPTNKGTGNLAPRTTMVPYEGTNRRYLPVSPRIRLQGTSVSIPLFKPIKSNDYGFLLFEYIGEKPLYATLSGTINFLARHARFPLPDRSHSFLLGLVQYHAPLLEMGQNAGNKWLASATGSLSEPREFSRYNEIADYCFPYDQAGLDSIAGNPELWPGPSENGWISTRDPTNPDLLTEEFGQPVGPDLLTTQWFDVSTRQRRVFVFNFEGTSSRFRVQVKRQDGSVYLDAQSGNVTAKRAFRVPPDAVEMRIYYAGYGDSVVPGTESIKPFGEATGAEYDPASGVWAEHSFAVQRDVVFWPNAVYGFRIIVQGNNDSLARSWGFRYQGGGLSFNFDAKDIYNQIGEAYYDYRN